MPVRFHPLGLPQEVPPGRNASTGRVRIPIKATAREPIKQARYI